MCWGLRLEAAPAVSPPAPRLLRTHIPASARKATPWLSPRNTKWKDILHFKLAYPICPKFSGGFSVPLNPQTDPTFSSHLAPKQDAPLLSGLCPTPTTTCGNSLPSSLSTPLPTLPHPWYLLPQLFTWLSLKAGLVRTFIPSVPLTGCPECKNVFYNKLDTAIHLG